MTAITTQYRRMTEKTKTENAETVDPVAAYYRRHQDAENKRKQEKWRHDEVYREQRKRLRLIGYHRKQKKKLEAAKKRRAQMAMVVELRRGFCTVVTADGSVLKASTITSASHANRRHVRAVGLDDIVRLRPVLKLPIKHRARPLWKARFAESITKRENAIVRCLMQHHHEYLFPCGDLFGFEMSMGRHFGSAALTVSEQSQLKESQKSSMGNMTPAEPERGISPERGIHATEEQAENEGAEGTLTEGGDKMT